MPPKPAAPEAQLPGSQLSQLLQLAATNPAPGPSDPPENKQRDFKKYAITGIQNVPVRRELDEWWFSKDPTDEKQRTLFILALIKFQDMPVTEKLSYFQIAGKFSHLVLT